ncbi:MAG: Spx/MgsR family RNA polymerase-binding regulatory protein [Clostridia bacterium]|nr:Spx/MgsR family RNA polymerase-binding regulatory protein [Clostridia bacterium]
MASPLAFLYPNCTSCRRAREWLSEHAPGFRERHIYREPPSQDELRAIARALPGGAEALLARRSRRFRELGFADHPDRLPKDEEGLIRLLAEEPRLLRRPIVTDGRKAVAGWDRDAFEAAFGR